MNATVDFYANLLNGREYSKEMDNIAESDLKERGIVVLFGYSDDNMEFRGAIHDEIGCYGGREVFVTKDGLLKHPGCLQCEECKYFIKYSKNSKSIKAIWYEDVYAWRYHTDIVHKTFEIFEGGRPFCLGIVFCLSDI